MTLPAQVSHGDSLRDTLTTVAEEVESSKTDFRLGLLFLLDSVVIQCESGVCCCCWTLRKPCYDPVSVILPFSQPCSTTGRGGRTARKVLELVHNPLAYYCSERVQRPLFQNSMKRNVNLESES